MVKNHTFNYTLTNFIFVSIFVGMVTSYYLYSNFVAGFFPKSYAMIWSLFTLLSPVLAFFCWYAKGKGWSAFIISAGILGFIINSTLSYGMWYVDIRSYLHLLTLILGIIILHKSTKETICMFVMAIPKDTRALNTHKALCAAPISMGRG